MKKRKTFIAMALVIAVLVLGVGYAAISNITLNVNGTANVTANADFNVEFDTDHTVDVETGAAGAYTNTTTATMTVNLDSNTKTTSAIYKIDNTSSELSANLTAKVTNDDEGLNKYVAITSQLYSDADCTAELTGPIAKGTSAYLKVTASITNNPSKDVADKKFTVTITAEPADAN